MTTGATARDDIEAARGREGGAVGRGTHRWYGFPMPFHGARRLTTVTTSDETGHFEIAPGTGWDPGEGFDRDGFPKSRCPDLEALAVRRYPKVGDLPARTALTGSRVSQRLCVVVVETPTPIALKHTIGGLGRGEA